MDRELLKDVLVAIEVYEEKYGRMDADTKADLITAALGHFKAKKGKKQRIKAREEGGWMKSYKRIAAADLTMRIIEFMADQRLPVTGQEVAAALSMKYDTVMCHLATQEDRNFVECIGDRYKPGPKIAHAWARYKSRLQAQKYRIEDELKQLEVADG